MSTHTPGPWTQNRNVVWSDSCKDCGYIAECRNEINARLIAAAPDLLEACKAVRGYVEAWAMHLNDTGRQKASADVLTAWDKLLAAIAKAEGKR